MKNNQPKFTDGKINAPMYAFLKKDSLASFQDKRKELSGEVSMTSVLSKQRKAAMERQ
jgi:hypothetical protein